MTTATMDLSPLGSTLPDGSSNNAAPQFSRNKGTTASSNGELFWESLDFDASTREQTWYQTTVPQNYASTPVLRIKWCANATTGNVVWGCRVGALTPGDTDTHFNHAMATAQTTTTAVPGTTAYKPAETTISITNTDSMAAGDFLLIQVYRDAANGSDTCSVDAKITHVTLDYTTT